MKPRSKLAFLLLFVLLLAGCQASPKEPVNPEEQASSAEQPSSAEQTSSESSGSGGEVSSIRSKPAPVSKTPQELLAEQPIDDTHDAFLVDTNGRMGTLLVTAELGTERGEFEVSMSLSIWNPLDMSQPLQTIETETLVFCEEEILDVNFDGYQDLTCLYSRGVQVQCYQCWLWDEEQGLFVKLPVYSDIPSPYVDPETETISGWSRSSAAGDGTTPIYKWLDGELTCVRKIEVFPKDWRDPDSPMAVTVEDWIDGGLTEVFRGEYPLGSDEYFDVSIKWEDLNYHGETE